MYRSLQKRHERYSPKSCVRTLDNNKEHRFNDITTNRMIRPIHSSHCPNVRSNTMKFIQRACNSYAENDGTIKDTGRVTLLSIKRGNNKETTKIPPCHYLTKQGNPIQGNLKHYIPYKSISEKLQRMIKSARNRTVGGQRLRSLWLQLSGELVLPFEDSMSVYEWNEKASQLIHNVCMYGNNLFKGDSAGDRDIYNKLIDDIPTDDTLAKIMKDDTEDFRKLLDAYNTLQSDEDIEPNPAEKNKEIKTLHAGLQSIKQQGSDEENINGSNMNVKIEDDGVHNIIYNIKPNGVGQENTTIEEEGEDEDEL